MLYDPDVFALPAMLRAAFPLIRQEVDALPTEAFVRWPNEADVEGTVRVVPLHLKYRPELLPPFASLEAPARRVCARTWELLGDVVVSLVVSRMEPGCRVLPHRDLDGPDHLRCHLGLHASPGAWMRVGERRFEWREGDCVVFDPRREHEVANDSQRVRTILIVDFVPSAAETAALVASGQPLPLA
ncbi:MAG: aspartyl/asparaginyl beta-hydroxylase domain-containing protein [Planctomycetes bacterium]|nr:aspartyl/asparaginyl beta-hydroxylase domain-containing protein [Planctomycetota bacterium]